MENPCVNSNITYFNLHNVQFNVFPRPLTDLSTFSWVQLLPFNPLNRFIISFQDNSNLVSLCFRLLVYNKRSPVYPALARHQQTLKGVNKSIIILSCLLYHTQHQSLLSVVARISIMLYTRNQPVALWESNLSLLKVYEGPLGYVEESSLTLCNHFIQLYKALDTTFSKYRIVQNFGEVKLWRIGRFQILVRKTLANTPIWNIGDGKTLANSRSLTPISSCISQILSRSIITACM